MNLKIKKSILLILFPLLFLSLFLSTTNPVSAGGNCTWSVINKAMTTSYQQNTIISKVIIKSGTCEEKQMTQFSDDFCSATPKPKTKGLDEAVCCCETQEPVQEPVAARFTIPDFQVQIPGLNKLAPVTCPVGEKYNIPWIGQYIAGLYNYALGIVGILAAIMLMAGGLLWLISAGDASKITKAKELIIGSISGLIILLVSYTILTIVNPDLVNLKGVNVSSVQKIVITPIKNGSDSTENAVGTCAKDKEIQPISDLVSTSATSPFLAPEGIDGLSLAISEAQKRGVNLHVVSAFRTAQHQQELWEAALRTYGNELEAQKWVAKPGSCGGHRSGKAIDLCIKGTESCNHIGGKANAEYSDADVEKLKEIMQAAGWVRYCGEWWHYQYNEPMNNPCPNS